MERLTRTSNESNFYIVDNDKINHVNNGYTGEVITKLAKFENFYDDLVASQGEISQELEKLRLEGKTHSVKFKQLLTTKLTNANILILLKRYGLE